VCIFFVLVIVPSVAEEVPEEGYYQEEEEEDYPGYFANQGKPSFESYPIPSFQIAYFLVFKLNCMIQLLE
jgi:hypothetical protein